MLDQLESHKVQFVVFTINNQLYSIYIEEVVEILRLPSITSVPGINSNIEGVINLRGSIIPVLSLHKRFKIKIPRENRKNRVVIVKGKNENIGLIVEEVRMVTEFDINNLEPTSGQAVEENMFVGFAKKDGQVIGVLNLENVLYSEPIIS